MRTVGEVSELAGVTVRALHHYDEVGLLRPSGRSDAGYRLYSYEDLERLQEILGWRRLGFSLSEVQNMLDDPAYDRADALRRQRELVNRDLDRLQTLRAALDAALDAERNGTRLKETIMFEGFDPAEYDEEARERWEHTEAYRESTRRATAYGDAEWAAIREELEEIVHAFAELQRAGEPADGSGARAQLRASRDRARCLRTRREWRERRRASDPQPVIGTCPGCVPTRASQELIAG